MLSQPALSSALNINVETKKHILINKEAQVCLADSKFFKVLPEFLNNYPCIIYTMLPCANTEHGPQRRDVSCLKHRPYLFTVEVISYLFKFFAHIFQSTWCERKAEDMQFIIAFPPLLLRGRDADSILIGH